MATATLDRLRHPPAGKLSGCQLFVLARLACNEGATRPELDRDLGPLGMSRKGQIEKAIVSLAADGLVA